MKQINLNEKIGNKLWTGRPELPPLKDVKLCLSEIWSHEQLTNFGEYENLFSRKLIEYLQVENVILFSSGTAALEALIAVLDLRGSIITTPYSFVATTTAIMRNKITPAFADVCFSDGNINPSKIEEKIDKNAELILGVHSYGFPCDIERINEISQVKHLPVIYDAAHTMGALFNGTHLAKFGLASILSFHATKIMSTVEGGAVITEDSALAKCLREFRYFGFNSDRTKINGLGTNSKMSEINAAIGTLQLENFSRTLRIRKEIMECYTKKLFGNGLIETMSPRFGAAPNGSYMPVIVNRPNVRDKLITHLAQSNIFAKAYFNTNLSQIYGAFELDTHAYTNTKLLTERIICLPIHSSMSTGDVQRVIDKINKFGDQYA